jgi:diaminobutyrate-2-oxoglutarate transaminase
MILPLSASAISDQAGDAVFLRRESEVRSYCRSFPAVFAKARGSTLWDEHGASWLDFLAGAGTLNYGHNDPVLKRAAIEHLAGDGVLHGLDLHTTTKRSFLETFERIVLQPRGLDYKVQFTGPTGTNAVEAAFKLARKATGRSTILSFTNGYHGMSLGALAATGNAQARAGAGVPLPNVQFAPFDGYLGAVDTAAHIARMLDDASSGCDLPAAMVLETVQGEGGLNVASEAWLRAIAMICRERGILLIVDDIQAGCGRTGSFFSFEPAGIRPDLVVLSKAIGGLGLPMSLVLLRPELDLWKPGEHNGTFRGNNLAFVTAEAALREYWDGPLFERRVRGKSALLREQLEAIAARFSAAGFIVRGRGLMQGLRCDPRLAAAISHAAFERGLIIERCGPADDVLKVMPPLTIGLDELRRGLAILMESVAAVV